MKSLTYRLPCDANGDFADWLNALRNQSGAYIIRHRRTREILYVGESHTGSLAKTLKRHFYPWRDDPERRHNTYDRQAVEVAVRLTPPTTAVGAQDNLIRRLEPRDNGYVPVDKPF
jgi:excinuclease UvrABC nuclease subunit